MTRLTTRLALLLPPLLSLAFGIEASPVLKSGERCFQIGEVMNDQKNWTLKIKPQQPLPTRSGALVETVALAHGIQGNDPNDTSVVQLSGAASFVTPGFGEAPYNTVRVSLLGNTYSRHDTGSRMVNWNVSLILQPDIKGAATVGRIIGIKTYSPLGTDGAPAPTLLEKSGDAGMHINLLDPDQGLERPTHVELNESLQEISCSKF